MASTLSAKIFIFVSAILFLIAAGLFAYGEELLYLLIPVFLIAALYFLQYPQFLFYLLMASIPWSVEIHFSQGMASDLPDDPAMLLTALACIVITIYNSRRNIERQTMHPLAFIIIVQLLWTIITVFTSTDVI